VARSMRKVRVGAVVRTNQDKTAIVEMVGNNVIGSIGNRCVE